MSEQPLTHQAHRTDSKAPLIAFFDATDIAVLGLTFFITINVTKKLIAASGFQLLATGIVVAVVYVLLMLFKRLLSPYPRMATHMMNWYFKPDLYEVQPDPDPTPLYRVRPKELDEDTT